MVWVTVAVLIAVVVGLSLWLKAKPTARKVPDAYRPTKPLSEPEQTLYWRLREAMPECVVLCQVAFSRFLEVQGGSPGVRGALFNRIAQKSVDFLICLPDFTIVAAVELDDGSHRADRDARRDAILKSADVPLVRLHVREIPSAEALRAVFTR